MIFPIGDDNSDRTTVPLVNYVFIAINILVFVFLQGMGGNDNKFTYSFSTVPQEIITGRDVTTPDRMVEEPLTHQRIQIAGLQPTPGSVYLTLLTSMFMHGGWAHLLGNMLFLWIFGDNIEHRLGHFRYAIFYLVGGVLASLAHVFSTAVLSDNASGLLIPSLGASGAISAVLGGYILLYPKRQVKVILLRMLTTVPAYVAIGIWFAFQLVSGLGILGDGAQEGGVAYAAHIGGFSAGLVRNKFFVIGRDGSAAPVVGSAKQI